MARYSFKLPDIGEGIAEAEIVAWHATVGDFLDEDAPLCDMMTDKATVEMTAPAAGKLVEVAGQIGEIIAIGSVLAVFEGEDEKAIEPAIEASLSDSGAIAAIKLRETGSEETSMPTSEAVQPAPVSAGQERRAHSQSRRVLASPAVRDRAEALGIDLSDIHTIEGRVRHADLDAFLGYNRNKGYGAPAPARPDEQIRVIGVRRRIAENMAASKRHIPHFSYVEEFDVTKLEQLRADSTLLISPARWGRNGAYRTTTLRDQTRRSMGHTRRSITAFIAGAGRTCGLQCSKR